jgi:hypothetical protein
MIPKMGVYMMNDYYELERECRRLRIEMEDFCREVQEMYWWAKSIFIAVVSVTISYLLNLTN